MANFRFETILLAPVELIWQEVQKPATLLFVSAPLVRFKPVGRDAFPATFPDGITEASMYLFGVIYIGKQVIDISRRELDTQSDQIYLLRDDGYGGLLRKWRHLIEIRKRDACSSIYTDDVTLDAGALTSLVAFLSRRFFRWRQRRWKNYCEHLQ